MNSRGIARRPRWYWAIGILTVSLSLGLSIRPGLAKFGFPMTEDGYLSQTIARHVGLGDGVTFDGIEPTNGFQPLWVFLCAPIHAIAGGGKSVAIGGVFLLSAAILTAAAAAWGLGLAAVLPTGSSFAWIYALLYVSAHEILIQHFNGLETGLLLLLFGLLLLASTAREPRPPVLGTLVGLLGLCRIDTLLFCGLYGLGFAWTRAQRRQEGITDVVMSTAAFALPPVCLIFPWLLYGKLAFGSWEPISGQSLQSDGSMTWTGSALNMASAIIKNVHPFLLAFVSRPAGLIATVTLIAIAVMTRFRKAAPSTVSPMLRVFAASFGIHVVFLAIYYSRNSLAAYFWPRYLSVLAPMGVALLALPLSRLWNSHQNAARLVATVGILYALAPAALTWCAWYGSATANRIYYPLTPYTNGPLLGQVSLAKQYAHPGDVVAGFQSGTLGFFLDGSRNLDGKVSYAVLSARRRDELVSYLCASNIRWIIDFWEFGERGRGWYDPADFTTAFRPIAPAGPHALYEMVVYQRTPVCDARQDPARSR